MNELDNFQQLKKRILETYQKSYPYFRGGWKRFSSKDIRQLIDLIEIQLKEKVSEKWIYTHLKPESNVKLPRKDMLDIFSKFCGFADWDEFVFKNQVKTKTENEIYTEINPSKSFFRSWFWLLMIPAMVALVYWFPKNKSESKTLEIKNEFTQEPIPTEEIKVYEIQEDVKIPLEIEDSKIEVTEGKQKIRIESPYFETKEVEISTSDDEILIKPEDYAMVLKHFIQSELKDWEDRKEKSDKILSDELEVIVLLKDNLGAEYLNKDEFSGKLIVPTSETRKMKILNIETNAQKQITFIRIQQL
ncbi:MAG: hypothetical protein WCY63_08505 [Weeksellaceae bacterium]